MRSSCRIGHHTCGIAKMSEDEMVVVDEKLHLCGTRSLRVANASIMPKMVSGNTDTATMMIAKKL